MWTVSFAIKSNLLHLVGLYFPRINNYARRPASWSSGSELLTTNHEVPGSIPGSSMGIFLVGGGSPW